MYVKLTVREEDIVKRDGSFAFQLFMESRRRGEKWLAERIVQYKEYYSSGYKMSLFLNKIVNAKLWRSRKRQGSGAGL